MQISCDEKKCSFIIDFSVEVNLNPEVPTCSQEHPVPKTELCVTVVYHIAAVSFLVHSKELLAVKWFYFRSVVESA